MAQLFFGISFFGIRDGRRWILSLISWSLAQKLSENKNNDTDVNLSEDYENLMRSLLGLSVWQRSVLSPPCCNGLHLSLARAACPPWGSDRGWDGKMEKAKDKWEMEGGQIIILEDWKAGKTRSHPLTVASTAASSPTRSSPTGASRQTTRSFLFSMCSTTWSVGFNKKIWICCCFVILK